MPELYGLASDTLRSRRVRRYHGENLAVGMGHFTSPDAARLERLYVFLKGLLLAVQGEEKTKSADFRKFVEEHFSTEIIDEVGDFGHTSYDRNPSRLLGQVIHDVRGGGLPSIFGNLQLWRPDSEDSTLLDSVYFLTRDHLKIMRNALLGLDDERRNADLEIKLHSSDLIVEKWHETRIRSGGKGVKLEVVCPQSFVLSECCVEFGALDRILYNVLNNACRHTVEDRIKLVLFPIPDAEGVTLRFVLLNAVSPEDRTRLENTDLSTLFRPDVSTTGSGLGLSVVAEFVAHAFGLVTPEQAVEGGFVGVRILEKQFAVWFHWPIVAEH